MTWDAKQVRALRRALKLTQQELAQELGVRQQTVSEWETGAYAPCGVSARLLDIVAERTGVDYEAGTGPQEDRRARPERRFRRGRAIRGRGGGRRSRTPGARWAWRR